MPRTTGSRRRWRGSSSSRSDALVLTEVAMQRRSFLQGSLAAGVLLSTRSLRAAAGASVATAGEPLARLAALEKAHGGRLGVAILDTATGRRINHRGEERFP